MRLLLIMLVVCSCCFADVADVDIYRPLLNAMYFVESSNGTNMDGEKGSIGPYQIRNLYWQDAIEHRPEIGGDWFDCMDKVYSEKIILSYWDRYASGSMDFKHLARLHNGGPSYMKRKKASENTLKYWKKIKNYLDSH